MGLIDTHCHLYLEDFDPEQEQLIEEAKASGIERLLMPNVDLTTIDRMHALNLHKLQLMPAFELKDHQQES